MVITEVEALSRLKTQVVIDDTIRLTLPSSVVQTLHLCVGESLSDAAFDSLYDEYVRRPAKLKALALLERRDYTRRELKEALSRRGFPEKAVVEALDYVDSYHYIDDTHYTESYLSYKAQGKSRRMIYQTLLSKGVDSETIRSCMEACPVDDVENIRQICRRKFGDIHETSPEKKQKIFNYFLRKGYKYGDIASVIKEFDSI